MRGLILQVDKVVVLTDGEQRTLERVSQVAQSAFALLAERLKGSPFERWGGAREVLFEELQISALNLDDLLGSRGAERLADILYQRMLEARR
jgi:hypothetical protein